MRQRRITFVVVLSVLAVVIGIVVWRFPAALVNRSIARQLNDYLIRNVGEDSEIGSVRIGWRSLYLEDIVLPLQGGSRLTIRSVEASVNPIEVFNQPDRLERVMRRLDIDEPELFLGKGTESSAETLEDSTGKNEKLFFTFCKIFDRFDSLKTVRVRHGEIRYHDPNDEQAVLIDGLNGSLIQHDPGVFKLRGSGYLFDLKGVSAAVEGDVLTKREETLLHINGHLNRGQIPLTVSDNVRLYSNGGAVKADLSVRDSLMSICGDGYISGIEAITPWGEMRIEAVDLQLADDTVHISPFTAESGLVTGTMEGCIILSKGGEIELAGDFTTPDTLHWETIDASLPPVTGRIDLSTKIKGALKNPHFSADFESVDLTIGELHSRSVSGAVGYYSDTLTVSDFSASTNTGNFSANGILKLSNGQILDGDLLFEPPDKIRSATESYGISEVFGKFRGKLSSPEADLAFRSGPGSCVLSGRLSRSDSQWVATLGGCRTNDRAVITWKPDGANSFFRIENLHNIASALSDKHPEYWEAMRSCELQVIGNRSEADIEIQTEFSYPTSSLFSRVAEKVQFCGSYSELGIDHYELKGQWQGQDWRGEPFEGRLELDYKKSRITIERLFLDAVADARGKMDLEKRDISLNVEIEDAVMTRLPIVQEWCDKLHLEGRVTGTVAVKGQLEKPDWQTSLSVVEGEMFALQDYWINLEASGSGATMTLERGEVGRGVERVLDISGIISPAEDSLSLAAEIGNADAADFLMALAGRKGLVSGSLDGRMTVQGKLSRPDLNAVIRMKSGQLFGFVSYDQLDASLKSNRNEDRELRLVIPSLRILKEGAYEFTGEADVVPKSEGELHAHLEGAGDFLDILEQNDRYFNTMGSRSSLRLDFGGTLEKPTLSNGELTIENGLFSYVEATPDPVSADAAVRLNQMGQVETGTLVLGTGNQWLRVASEPDAEVYGDLLPLAISQPRMNLGILVFETGEEGINVRLPGFMKPEWYGTIVLGSTTGSPVTISFYEDRKRLAIDGEARISGTRMTFPFYSSGQTGQLRPVTAWLVDRLKEAYWSLDIAFGSGNHYEVSITGIKESEFLAQYANQPLFKRIADYLDHLTIDVTLEPTDESLKIRETIADSTFYAEGRLSSVKGRVEYLDRSFRVEYANATFDHSDVFPIVEGRAVTAGVDSVGLRVPVYLATYSNDQSNNVRTRSGRLDELTFVLETDGDETPEEALQYLGYGLGTSSTPADQVMAKTFVRVLGHQWLDPLERKLERWTLLDEVGFYPGGSGLQPITRQQRVKVTEDTLRTWGVARYLTGSQLTVGKYLTDDIFLTYTGELIEGPSELEGSRLGLVHFWNLEYRMKPLSRDLVVDLAVEYDEVERKRDESVSLKYSFALEP